MHASPFCVCAALSSPQLLTEDAFLLEALLLALAALLRGAAAYPCALPIARALLEFAWLLRTHEESAVRRGALVALCAVGHALPPAVLVVECEDALSELQEWLRSRAMEDPEEGCRHLAAACHTIYGDKVRAWQSIGQ